MNIDVFFPCLGPSQQAKGLARVAKCSVNDNGSSENEGQHVRHNESGWQVNRRVLVVLGRIETFILRQNPGDIIWLSKSIVGASS